MTARVTVDGVEFPKVGIRKKGFIGSQNPNRPSLKIKLNHIDEKAELGGQSMLTFNNNNQDITLMSQFMGYALFNAAGPRHRGVASQDQRQRQTDRTLLTRGIGPQTPAQTRISRDRGTLFEGTVVDFYEGWENSLRRNSAGKRMETLPATRSRP
ncbi:MAG: hypothetical protein Ct9H300mP1_36090 [Planctomycetaceae bacterium]|nr:MAG: hypothetical protein Ct9H300mP1_36090 [Planctomycetaceae bacterium]